MSTLFTPVEGSGLVVSFDFLGDRTLSGKKRLVTPAAGTHLKINTFGECFPVFVSVAEPLTEAAMYQGTAIFPGDEYVLPRTGAVWISSPFGNTTVVLNVGTMT